MLMPFLFNKTYTSMRLKQSHRHVVPFTLIKYVPRVNGINYWRILLWMIILP